MLCSQYFACHIFLSLRSRSSSLLMLIVMFPLHASVLALTTASVIARPPQPDAVPSTHPLTGPAPPNAPAPPHGNPKSWTLSSSSSPASRPISQTPGKSWTSWKDVQKLIVLYVHKSPSSVSYVTNPTQWGLLHHHWLQCHSRPTISRPTYRQSSLSRLYVVQWPQLRRLSHLQIQRKPH